MHPERASLRFTLPAFPGLTLFEAGEATPLRPALHTVLFCPGKETVSLTYSARALLRRAYMPGLHREIPVSISLAGEAPVPYQPPVPVRDMLMQASQEIRHV